MTNPYPWNQRGRKPTPQVEPTQAQVREYLARQFGLREEKAPEPEPERKAGGESGVEETK
jgi:hypothetical protein